MALARERAWELEIPTLYGEYMISLLEMRGGKDAGWHGTASPHNQHTLSLYVANLVRYAAMVAPEGAFAQRVCATYKQFYDLVRAMTDRKRVLAA